MSLLLTLDKEEAIDRKAKRNHCLIDETPDRSQTVCSFQNRQSNQLCQMSSLSMILIHWPSAKENRETRFKCQSRRQVAIFHLHCTERSLVTTRPVKSLAMRAIKRIMMTTLLRSRMRSLAVTTSWTTKKSCFRELSWGTSLAGPRQGGSVDYTLRLKWKTMIMRMTVFLGAAGTVLLALSDSNTALLCK